MPISVNSRVSGESLADRLTASEVPPDQLDRMVKRLGITPGEDNFMPHIIAIASAIHAGRANASDFSASDEIFTTAKGVYEQVQEHLQRVQGGVSAAAEDVSPVAEALRQAQE